MRAARGRPSCAGWPRTSRRASAGRSCARAQADVELQIPEQPPVGGRVRLIPWADWVRVKALERFPHSPTVVREAVGHLLTRSAWEKLLAERGQESLSKQPVHPAVVEDALLET